MRKRTLQARCVQLFVHSSPDRNMDCACWDTRCIKKGEIHEIVTTDGNLIADRIPRIGFVGFFEFSNGGIVEKGDTILFQGKSIGTVLGFDESHSPNHYNIVIRSQELLTSDSLAMQLEDEISFEGDLLDRINPKYLAQ